MHNRKSINIAIAPTWDKVTTVLEQTEELLQGKDNTLISATTMAVTELTCVSQIGLYRISYEEQFDLDYQFTNGELTITASLAVD
jgi:hypothetical protein